MSKAAMRLEKVKDTKSMANRERHNTRSVNVASSNSKGEVIVKGVRGVSKHIKALEKQMNANLKAQGKRAIRKDAVRLIEVVMSSDSEFFDKYDYNTYLNDCEEFLKGFWGEDNIIQSAIHTDELTPHGHYFITPIKDGKFNYSSFINGRDDLSECQEQLEKFMLDKGYEIEHRSLASVTRKKHKTTREWSQGIQKADSMADLMDDKTLRDTAIDGFVSGKEVTRLSKQVESLITANIDLKKDISKVEEDRDKWKGKYNNLKTGVIKQSNVDYASSLETIGHKINMEHAKHKENTHFREKHKNENGMEH